ncbi:Hsp70 family protein [Skermania piniformis]|uniref:Hsp70 family protein n=2 Tax=Skermania pinensis TaxID=39122 RepID=A0ABX8SGK8_9ACTN|nr:Hsp70 family protein [Skermania piniformis]
MNSVLGVSVGAGAVRLARPLPGISSLVPESFELQEIPVGMQRAEELTAEAVGVDLATHRPAATTAIAYRSLQHERALNAAMDRQRLADYQLVPEISAIVAYLAAAGELDGLDTVAVYDLGASGLSVSVIDANTREVLYAERTCEISGDYFDVLIREHQIAAGRTTHPLDATALAALDDLCRNAKEQLSISSAVALPWEDGVVLLSRENFEALITLAIETSARVTRDVIMHSGRQVQAVFAVGGGAGIPLISRVLRKWLNTAVVVPEGPETVAARGATLLAQALPRPTRATPAPPPRAPVAAPTAPSAGSSRRELSSAGLAVGALAAVAAIGLALGYGGQVLERGSGTAEAPTSVVPTTPPRTTTMEPSNAVAPIKSATDATAPPAAPAAPVVTADLRTANSVPEAATPAAPQSAPEPEPGPNTVSIPGLPPVVIPTLPSGPILPPLPPLPVIPGLTGG